jgi:antitoxin component YwqK of YwqJK toxin-antitoxin module
LFLSLKNYYIATVYYKKKSLLKTKIVFRIFIISIGFALLSFDDPYSVKRISDKDFRYEFYTTYKKVHPKKDRMYYWFKGGLIHTAESGIAGVLLDGKYTKMYHNNQLAEQGFFRKGLKVGLWQTWFPNGLLETKQHWSKGLKSGSFYTYNESGEMLEKGSYTNNMKFGKWIDFTKNDTLTYNHDKIVINKPKKEKAAQPKTKIDKKVGDKKIKTSKKATPAKDATKPKEINKELKPKKDSFFKRLFSKKATNPITNGQSK